MDALIGRLSLLKIDVVVNLASRLMSYDSTFDDLIAENYKLLESLFE